MGKLLLIMGDLAAGKAVSLNKCDRYLTFTEFYNEWKKAVGIYLVN